MPLALTVSFTHRFSLGTQNFFTCIFEFHRRLVFRCEWETLFPKAGLLPVTWQILDMRRL